MDYDRLSKTILSVISNKPLDIGAYNDLFSLCRDWEGMDFRKAHDTNKRIKELAAQNMRKSQSKDIEKFYEQWRKCLLFDAPHDFDSFMLYMELDRDAKKRFYQPRRRVLKPVVDDLQALCIDDKLDLLSISVPPGCGKTTLALFLLTMLAGRDPNNPILTGSHSNAFIRGCYDEVLRLVDPNGEYLWKDIFPGIKVSNTNAKDCRIDFDKQQRFETLEFTSIGTGNAGLYRAATLLYCDDLVSGIEVALSKERLDKLWEIYTTDLRQRKIGDHCKELHIATRWSVHDVIGRLEREYENDPRAKFIRIPAMDESDESNFDYAYGVGFNTDFYRKQRDIMDDASWRALYMNEPIEREGLVYHPDELRRYFELPKEAPDAIIGVCDTKDKGMDYAFLPVGYVYGNDYYIDDCVCDNGLPDKVDVRLTDILVRDKVNSCRFESNSAGRRVAEKVQEEVKNRGGITHITTKFSVSNKVTRIIVNSSWVKEHCLFKSDNQYKRNSDYGRMMDMLCTYTVSGKVKHDDVPDGMAQFADYAQSLSGAEVTVFQRPF